MESDRIGYDSIGKKTYFWQKKSDLHNKEKSK